MSYIGSYLNICDNSGIVKIKVINICKKASKSKGFLGDIIIGTIKKLSKKYESKKLKKGDIVKGVIVSLNGTFKRNALIYKNQMSSAILLTNQFLPLGTKINGLVFIELRKKKFYKILTLALKIF